MTDLSLFEQIQKYQECNNTALYFENKKISYKEMFHHIYQLINYLRSEGIKQYDVVTVVLPNIPLSIYLFYALNAIGAKQNIIFPLTPIENIKQSMKKMSSSFCILLATQYQDNIQYFNDNNKYFFVNPMFDNSFLLRHIFYLKYKKIKQTNNIRLIDHYVHYQEDKNIYSHNPKDDSIYLHSGGTTSTPKVIALSDYAINNLANKVNYIIPYSLFGKSMLAVLPLFHGFGLGMGVHAPLANNASVGLMMKFNAKKVIKWINQNKINLIIGVPELYKRLLNDEAFLNSKLNNLEYCFIGGDNVNPSLIEQFNLEMKNHHSNCMLLEGYGLTETVTVCSVNTKENFKIGSVGKMLPNIETIILDDNMNVLKNNEIGELYISGDTLMNGYYLDEHATNDVFVNINNKKYVRTGDLGYIDDDGFIFLKGRKKRMFIISGFNIYPQEIEKLVCSINGIKDASLEMFETPKKHLNLYVIKDSEHAIDESILKQSIIDLLKKKITKYGMPSKIIFVDQFPKTRVGKIDHKAFKDED